MVKTAAQKEARKERRKAAKKKAETHGKRILQAAESSGYEPQGKKFIGKGKYAPKGVVMQRKMKGQGDIIDSLAEGAGNLVRRVGEWGLSKLGGVVKGILGVGDYAKSGTPQENGYIAGSMPKMLGAGGESEVIIAHHEMITELFACEEFTSTSYHLNPGLAETFPWLSPQANQYEQYELEAMMVVFVPTLSPFSEAASGDLGLVVDYDTTSIPKSSIAGAANQYLSVFGRPMDKMAMAVECAPKETPVRIKKVRAAEISSSDQGNDDQWYDHGILRIYQQGQPTATVGQSIGRLYVVYKFRFYKPTTEVIPLQSPTAHYKVVANLSSTTPFGTSAADFVAGVGNSLPLTWITGTTFAMPPYVFQGKWMLIVHTMSGSGALTNPGIGAATSNSALALQADGTGYDKASTTRSPTVGSTSNEGCTIYTFNVTGQSPTISLGTFTSTSPAYLEIWVVPLDIDLVSFHYARKACRKREAIMQREVALDWRNKRQWYDAEQKEIDELKSQVKNLVQMVGWERMQDMRARLHNDELPYEEKDEEEPPLRLPRKRVTQEVPDDDDESIVSIRTRTSSKNKSGAVTKPE